MKLTSKASVDFTFHLIITETEMRALDGLVGYGFEAFIKVFYEKLGKAYMEQHEAGLKNLFARIEELRDNLGAVDDLKKQAYELSKKYMI